MADHLRSRSSSSTRTAAMPMNKPACASSHAIVPQPATKRTSTEISSDNIDHRTR